ncbi:MAG: HAD-IIA family hydrolase [Actinomycetota bacterium]|nr:HAD-IIA family hydrolase [Actinomycetota bacterium]
MSLSPLVSRYEQVILDLDGCVWTGGEAIAGSPEAIEALRSAGLRVVFVTNNSRATTEEYVAQLWGIGVRASLADVVTAGGALQHLLAETRPGRSAFVIGTEAIRRHVDDAGLKVMNGSDLASRAQVVVVASTEQFAYDDLRTASLAVQRGADLLATGRDPTHPMPDGLWPGTGAILAAVETASGTKAALVGKPEPQLFLTAVDRLGDGRTLVVGDRLDSDVAAAAAAGLDAALVLSGGTTRREAEAAARQADAPKPVKIADDLASLVNGEAE